VRSEQPEDQFSERAWARIQQQIASGELSKKDLAGIIDSLIANCEEGRRSNPDLIPFFDVEVVVDKAIRMIDIRDWGDTARDTVELGKWMRASTAAFAEVHQDRPPQRNRFGDPYSSRRWRKEFRAPVLAQIGCAYCDAPRSVIGAEVGTSLGPLLVGIPTQLGPSILLSWRDGAYDQMIDDWLAKSATQCSRCKTILCYPALDLLRAVANERKPGWAFAHSPADETRDMTRDEVVAAKRASGSESA
jgi:hypothetical protein